MSGKILVYYSAEAAFLATTFTNTVRSELPNVSIFASEIPVNTGTVAWDDVRRSHPDVVSFICGSSLRGHLQNLIGGFRAEHPNLPLVFVRDPSRKDVAELPSGLEGTDYFSLPSPEGSLRNSFARYFRRVPDRRAPAPEPDFEGLESHIIGRSAKFVQALSRVRAAARSQAPVLITGESGTGKGLIARAIHYLSNRSGGPFVPVQCGAIPNELIENELFGHEAGAYTRAGSKRHGLVAEAEKGTLFLDEIDALPVLAQPKLLGLLHDFEYHSVGQSKLKKADVRVITASNTDLRKSIEAGKFREDLYWRISVMAIHIPPLRERIDDIPNLAQHFLEKHAHNEGYPAYQLSDRVLGRLMMHDWPGNVRELEHVIHQGLVYSQGDEIQIEHLTFSDRRGETGGGTFKELKQKLISDWEQQYLMNLLEFTKGNKSRAPRLANLDLRSFRRMIRKYRIDV